ncbi:MAG: FAD-dependent oxidoreductase [Firmicutes bacterium]|nr:FAD-dependent oxidoreductase [Bacillota bacterium]
MGGRPVDADVVVVGAGPAGSATALRLARAGVRVTIVDRAVFPRFKPCGEYLNPAAVAALERLGVAAEAAAAGVTLSGMFVAGPDGTAFWAPFAAGRGLLVPRARLDALLLAAAARAGACVLEGCRVDAVHPGPTPTVRGRCSGRPVHLAARLVVGADGVRSVAARWAGPLAPPAGARYTVGAYFEGVRIEGPRGDLHLGAACYAGAAIYGWGAGNVVAALPAGWLRAHRTVEGAFAAAVASLPALAPALASARRASPFVAAGPLGFARRAAVADGLLLVGDAAGTIDPMTGEGIALALRGAELAAAVAIQALAGGPVTRGALASYERARARAFGDVWRTSRLLQWAVRRPRLLPGLVRRLAARPALAAGLLAVVSELRPAAHLLTPRWLLEAVRP